LLYNHTELTIETNTFNIARQLVINSYAHKLEAIFYLCDKTWV